MNRIATIIVEHVSGSLNPAVFELLALAEKMQETQDLKIRFIVLGQDTARPAKALYEKTGIDVHAIDHPKLAHYNGSLYKKILSRFFSDDPSNYILALHSSMGSDYIPALAIALKGACITCVENIGAKNDRVQFLRTLHGGKISAQFLDDSGSDSAPLLITLLPGAFKPCHPKAAANGQLFETRSDCPADEMVFIKESPSLSRGTGFDRAEVIVSGGRGLKEEENYRYIEALANLFPRSATAASRPVCDDKWADYEKQIGITGATVSPKLYIACGISGAYQHVAGIKDSKLIVAINTDPDAPIFRIADICITADLTTFIPIFIDKVKNRRD